MANIGKKPEQIKFDPKKFSELVQPLTVRLSRVRDGQVPEVMPLPNDGVGMSPEEVLGVEKHVNSKFGGGRYHIQVGDSNGQSMEWQFMYNTSSVIPAEFRQQAQAAQAHSAAVGADPNAYPQQQLPMPAPVDPWGRMPASPSPWPQPAPFGMPNPWAPNAPPPQFGQPAAPWSPWGPPPSQFGPQFGPQSPWGSPPGWNPYGGLPPQIPPVADDAKLRALEAQNQQLREDMIRRQANEAQTMLGARLDQLAAQTQQRFEQMLAKLGESRQPDVEATRLDRIEQQRREDLARVEAQRREDEFKRELMSVKEEARRSEEKMRSEMQAAQQQGATQNMMQAILDRQAASQQASIQSIESLFNRFQPLMMSPEKIIALMDKAPANNSITDRLAAAALDNLAGGGGGGGTAQVVADLGRAVLETGTKVTQAIVGAKADEQNAKLRAEAQAKAQLNAQQQQYARAQQQAAQLRAQQEAQARAQMPANGLAGASAAPTNGTAPPNGVPANGVPQVPMAPVIPITVASGAPPSTAEAALFADESAYFGPVLPYIYKLRSVVAADALTADKVVDIVVTEYIRNVGDWEMMPPVFVDLKENPHRAVQRALPDAPGSFRQAIIELLPEALAEAIAEFNEAGAEAATAEEAAEAAAGNGAPPVSA